MRNRGVKPQNGHICRVGLWQAHKVQPCERVQPFWKIQRELQDFRVFIIKACAIGPINTKPKLRIFQLQKSALTFLSFLATFCVSFIFTAFWYMLQFLLLPIVSKFLVLLRKDTTELAKWQLGAYAGFFVSLKIVHLGYFAKNAKKKKNHPLKAVILFVRSRAHLIPKYEKIFDMNHKKFD